MYFIFKHAEHSPYKDKPGEYYHYTQRSPNYSKVKEGSCVLCYQKETDTIFALARVGRISVREVMGVRNYRAHYEDYEELERPVFLEDIRGHIRLRDLQRPSPGIIPLDKETFERIVRTIELLEQEPQP